MNENMNQTDLSELFVRRPEKITDDYGNHYIYNDGEKRYERVMKNKPNIHYVCNVESFAKAVRYERDITKDQIVIFRENGATLFTDELLGEEQNKWKFERKYTLLFMKVVSICRKEEPLTHKELLDELESVKNFIPDFEKLYQILSRLRISKKINFASNPIFTEGEQAGVYEWEQKVDANGPTVKAQCPSSIRFKGRLVVASKAEYEFYVNIIPVIDETNGRILFRLFMPTLELVLEQVREDEQKDFLELIGKECAEGLLILNDY